MAPTTPTAPKLSKLDQLMAAGRVFHKGTWPGLELPLRLKSLSKHELQAALGAAYKHFREQLQLEVNVYTVDDLNDEYAMQVLHLACRDAEQPETSTFAVDADDFRRNASPSVMEELLAQWKPIQDRENPGPYPGVPAEQLAALGLTPLSADDQAEIFEAVKKKDASRLRRFERDVLVTWLITTGGRRSI